MKQDKMDLINKIFNNETIRTVWFSLFLKNVDMSKKKIYYINKYKKRGLIMKKNNNVNCYNLDISCKRLCCFFGPLKNVLMN